MAALDPRIGFGPCGVVAFLAVDAGDDRRILDSHGADIEHRRSALLKSGIDGDGGSHDDALALFRPRGQLSNPLDWSVRRSFRRRGYLGDRDLARGGIEGHQIGEGAAGVDADPKHVMTSLVASFN